MKLISDVISIMRGRQVYGKAGDQVKLISVSEPVAIVENLRGDRFPTLFDNLEEISPPKEVKDLKNNKQNSLTQQNLF